MVSRPPNTRIFLTPGRALFLGPMPELPLHRHAAAAMIFGCEGEIEVRGDGGDWQSCEAVLIPPFSYHGTRSGDRTMGVLFQEPGSEMFDRLARDREWLFEPGEFQGVLKELRDFAARTNDSAGNDDGLVVQAILSRTATSRKNLDARVRKTVELLEQEPETTVGVEELARRVGISGSRLIHLFGSEMGIPLRRFRGWHRMKVAARELAAGADLTTAAHAAGFFDSAHFSRGFKNMFGLPPSEIFREGTRIFLPVENQTVQ